MRLSRLDGAGRSNPGVVSSNLAEVKDTVGDKSLEKFIPKKKFFSNSVDYKETLSNKCFLC